MVSLEDGEKGLAPRSSTTDSLGSQLLPEADLSVGVAAESEPSVNGMRPRAQAAQRSQTGPPARRNQNFPPKTGSCWTESRGTTKMQSTKMQALASGAGRASPSSPKGL